MKITFNPSTVAALTTPPNNKDITFDLRGHSIFARGVEFKGTDTNTWRDIKINNVSIGSHTLDLRNGSNTTLTNTNGVVTINSTWRPVVDNLTSDSTTSSLSAKQGKVLKALIDGKSNSEHNHDGRYVRYYAVTALDCDNLAAGLTAARTSATNAAHTNNSAYLHISDVGTPFQIQIPDSIIPYIYKRCYSSGKWSEWFKLSAGYADSAGSVAWTNVTGKPSSYTPSEHTHAWNSLTHSSTTENQAILTNGKANGWKLQTLNIARWDNAANNAHSHANKSVLDDITSALVNSWNTAYNFVSNITGTDTDNVINKWEEIVNFLAGIIEDNKLNTLLNSKLSVYELAYNTNVETIKNNGIYYSTTDDSSGTLINSPFNTGYAFINMTSYDKGDDLRRSRLAFNAFGEIKVSDDRDQANTAETWYNVLTSKNSGINGSTIKLNGTSITVYSSGTADGRYVKKSGDTMSGVLTIDTTNFGALTIKRNDDANGASIQFRGKSSVYGYIGLDNSTKDKQFLRWGGSDSSRVYTILDTSSTYISNGKGVINGTTITQVDNATNSTNSTNADMVDGYHENSFLRYRGATYTDQEATLWSQIGIKQYNNALPDNLTGVYNYGSVISLPGFDSRFEIYASHQSSNGNGLYYRSGWSNDKKAWLKFIDSSNIGSQSVNYANSAGHANSAGNADTLGGLPRNYGQAPFGKIPSIENDGVMEVGKYIDFHNDNSGNYDFSTRLQTTGNYVNIVHLPSESGTLALTSYGGDYSTPIFLGYLNLFHGNDGTISSYFSCLGYSVPFTYTRGGNYCRVVIPDTTRLSFFIIAAIASVNYSGGGMDTWVGNHRGAGAWWLHCAVESLNEVRVKGFRLANSHNDSWWGGNPLYSDGNGANKITVFIFGYARHK